MKIQDVGFFIILTVLVVFRKPTWFVTTGLISLILAIPLFAKWVFFTGERLTWYAAAFFLCAIIMNLLPKRKVT